MDWHSSVRIPYKYWILKHGETCRGNTRRTLRRSKDRDHLKAMRVPSNYVYFVAADR